MGRDGTAKGVSNILTLVRLDLLGHVEEKTFRNVESARNIVIRRQHGRLLSSEVSSIKRPSSSIECKTAHFQNTLQITPDDVHPIDIDVERV